MWAGLHFVNGYSPIRPSGIARQWFFSIHGEIDLGTVWWLLSHEAGPGRELAQLGIDGIIVANEMDFAPEPADEWELAFSNDEGRVFHRRGPPFECVRSATAIASRPGTLFSRATVSGVRNFRNSVAADVEVPPGNQSALITFSRPFFEGYKATLGGRSLEVRSERGIYPVVEVPPGSNGRLSLKYRPAWLVCGGAISLGCAALWLSALVFATNPAIRRRAR
jgi:hypothetical protein